MKLSGRKILLVTLVVEGSLILITLLWAYLRERSLPLMPTTEDWLLGVASAMALGLINYTLFGTSGSRWEFIKTCHAFRDDILIPLARSLTWQEGLLVSILAGLGEELFFRFLIQSELGIVVASVLFAFLHFGPAIVNYYFIATIYLLFGLYFGLVIEAGYSIWSVIIAHTVYDFAALSYLRLGRFSTIQVSKT